jgi:molecular chaperone DnaK (HSP70)
MKNVFYGIDFGTSNAAVAAIGNQRKPEIIPLDPVSKNPYVIRTMIYISRKGEFSFGEEAVNSYNEDVKNAKPAQKKTVWTGRKIKVASPASRKSGFVPDRIIDEAFEIDDIQTGRLLQGIKSLLGNESIQKMNLFGKEYGIEELVGLF